ncbi:MAG: nucleotidyl transferase AbiEii/AbiGii toxin family protein [Deltaproteobacteria bacterium]|nr:nucleotidyl transferase AbiEii/AbiGii toxin family protein [Deltaproteobacteria bacterium]
MSEIAYANVFDALAKANVRYIVVGGVAVVLHGHLRYTADLDLVVSLEPKNTEAALQALHGLGYEPRVPVKLEEFADPAQRERWIAEKHMRVFSLWNPSAPSHVVDIFVREPFPFDEAFTRSLEVRVGGDTPIHVASIDDLIALKICAGRPRDIEDIEALRKIQELMKTEGADGKERDE